LGGGSGVEVVAWLDTVSSVASRCIYFLGGKRWPRANCFPVTPYAILILLHSPDEGFASDMQAPDDDEMQRLDIG
jgi:hypothetical protein